MRCAGILRALFALTVAAFCALGTGPVRAALVSEVTIQTVHVGNAGNLNDSTSYGAVAYEYGIGQFEVTVAQYVNFLNAVAASDPNGLFSPISDDATGITRTGAAGSYQYAAVAGRDNFPVARVSWFDAARFVNWLQNGQLTGAQDSKTTENGVYDMSLGAAAQRQTNALWALPTASEWYKAAYYDPTKGPSGGYWLYPTRSSNAPVSQAPPGGANSANYAPGGAYPIGYPYWYSNVGAYTGSASYYDTFDQAGNVGEWLEEDAAGLRSIRGGSLNSSQASSLASTFAAASDPAWEYFDVGFRVVELSPLSAPPPSPEPTTLALLAAGGLAMSGSALRRRRVFKTH